MSTEQPPQGRRQGRPVRVLGTLVCLLVAVGFVGPSAQAAFPGRNGRIGLALTYEGSNTFSKVVMSLRLDGSGLQALWEVRDGEIDAAFSPSGHKLVLARDPAYDSRRGVYLIRADGRGRRRLLARAGRGWADYNPDWSPDGRAVVYERTGAGRGPLIKVYRAGRSRTLAGGRTPAWSSRGTIAFNRGRSIYVMRSNGSGLRRVALGECLDWSPRGQWILFATAKRELAMVRPDGTDMRLLLRPATGATPIGLEWEPFGSAAFAPDGKAVAVIGYRPGDFTQGLQVARLDGSGGREINLNDLEEGAQGGVLDWSPLAGR